MQVGIMITNGGPHPPDKWAAQTAQSICDLIQIDEASDSPEATAARRAKPRLQLDLADVFESMHRANQTTERGNIKKNGTRVLAEPIGVSPALIQAIMKDVLAVTDKTPFAQHFALSAVQRVVGNIMAQHLGNAIHIERSWHADRHPDSDHAKAFRQRQLANA